MKVLIVGGTGFIGPKVLGELCDRGHDVALFHRGQTAREPPKTVSEILGDRDELSGFKRRFADFNPDVVPHMIAFMKQHAEVAAKTFAGIARRMVMISSQDVYRAYGRIIEVEPGEPDAVPLTEDAPLRERLYPYRADTPREDNDPNRWMDDYEKILIEEVTMSHADLQGTVLRLPMVYGPRDRQHRLFEFLKRMDDGRSAILLERYVADWRWTRAYVGNVAHAIVLAVENDHAAGKNYNIGDEPNLSMAEWVTEIGKAAGWDGDVLAVAKEHLPEHLNQEMNTSQDLVVDTSRIRDELGYTEIVPMDEALKRTIEWERENPPAEIDKKQFDYEAEDAVLRKLRAHDS